MTKCNNDRKIGYWRNERMTYAGNKKNRVMMNENYNTKKATWVHYSVMFVFRAEHLEIQEESHTTELQGKPRIITVSTIVIVGSKERTWGPASPL